MRHLKISLLIGLLFFIPSCGAPAAPTVDHHTIGMVTIASHPSLDAIQQGVKDRLAEAGFVDGDNLTIIEGNAEGDMATLSTIVQQFIDQEVDLIVATTTPAAQAAYNATKDAGGPPIIYNGVSNPYIAGLAVSADDHPAWIVGNQLLDPVEDAMELAKELVPDLEVAGLVYNPAEANSEFLVGIAQELAEDLGIILEVAPISNSSEIQTAAESLLNRGVGAYIAISDNTLTSGFEALVQTANENDVPVIGTSASMPGLGATASYGIDPYQEGLDSGDLVVQYLQGELDIAAAPIRIQDAVLLTVNPGAAEAQGITLPDALLENANTVIEE
jgi:putative ABC transport system substrate-binding protein